VNFIINNIFLIGVAVACIVLLLLPTLQGRGPHQSVYMVTQKMNKERIVFVDIRKDEEYDTAHIKNAIHIPIEELKEKLGRIERYKNDPVVVICANGKRSSRATADLKKAGFKDVSSIEGGMKAWIDDGMPTEGSDAEAEKGKAKKKGKA